MKSHTFIVLMVLFLGISTASVRGQTAFHAVSSQRSVSQIPLLKTTGVVQVQWSKKAEYEIRRSSVEINSLILSPLSITRGDVLNIMLFDGEQYSVTLGRVVVDVNNVLSISGRIKGKQYGFFYLSTRNGITLAMIEIIEENKKYLITYDKSTGGHYVTEVDPLRTDRFDCGPPLIPQRNGNN